MQKSHVKFKDGHESQKLTPALEFTCCHNSYHVYELSPSYSQLGNYLLNLVHGPPLCCAWPLELGMIWSFPERLGACSLIVALLLS